MVRAASMIAFGLVAMTISSASASIQINGFTGVYDVSNWTQTFDIGGDIDTSNAPDSVTLTSSDTDSFLDADVIISIVAQATGTFEFTWEYESFDIDGPEYDPAFFVNDVLIQLTDDFGVPQQGGAISVPVSEGNLIGFQITAIDDSLGEAVLTITGFSAPAHAAGAIPEPTAAAVWSLLAACGVGIGLRRKAA